MLFRSDGDHMAASLLARAIHQDPVAITDISTETLNMPLSPTDLGIWIDPIGTAHSFVSPNAKSMANHSWSLTFYILKCSVLLCVFLDATSQYIEGREEVLVEGHLSPSGLQCALVLIGVYHRATGEPVMGVINQPFHHKDSTGGYVLTPSFTI